MTNVWYVKNVLANCDHGNLYLPISFTSPKGRIALQVARKIASCDRALILCNTCFFMLAL